MKALRILLPLVAVLIASSCDGLFGPDIGPPAELLLVAGDAQSGTVGKRLGDTLVVKVVDAEGQVVEGAVISWSVVGDGGAVRPASDTTGADGLARTRWSLGTMAGQQEVEASAAIAGVDARFRASAQPDAPVSVVREEGDGQEAAVTASLEEPLVILVEDRYGNPVPDTEVQWSVTKGGGVLDIASELTGADGRSEAHWTLGTASGEQLVSVRVTTRLVYFHAAGLAGPPVGANVVRGDGQQAPAGRALPQPLEVRIHDEHDNPVVGVEAVWTVTAGAGTLQVSDPVTDEEGITRALWTLGTESDTQRVEVTSADSVLHFSALVSDCDVTGPDTDGDRLADCAETATGVYVGTWDTGTDPARVDTDDDGISDGDEVLGTEGGLDLPALGVSPLRYDILLEYDWFVDSNDGCSTHSHNPRTAVHGVSRMFAEAPVQNPDGTTGVNVIHDYGQGGVFTGGNLIDDANGVLVGGVGGQEFIDYKATHLAPERRGYFHYVLLPHRYNGDSDSSGQAYINGLDLIVSLQCYVGNTSAVANTIAHELGHNLGLRHGGGENTNWKPNYNSVMNYRFQFDGVDTNCSGGGDRRLDFSSGLRPALDETNLDENTGVCGDPSDPAYDWNGDGDSSDSGVQADINADWEGNGDGWYTVLQDYDDWANLYFAGPAAGEGLAPLALREVSVCRDVPPQLEH